MTGSKEILGGFEPTIRTFWLKGANLIVGRHWSRKLLIDPQNAPKFSFSISGKGVSEKDSVCVIGAKERIKEFALTINLDDDAKAEWESIKSCDPGPKEGNSPELQLEERIRERLDEAPPTAAMFVTEADWEIGNKAGWSMECKVPQAVLTQLESELIAGRVQEVYIGIEWVGGLVEDKHAPPSFPTTWGMFKISEERSPEPLRGYVTSFSWSVSPCTS